MADYTTVAESRIAAGIVGNLNISTTSIETKIAMANSFINGKIIDAYSLPLEEVPSLIQEIAREIVASWILIDEYGKEAQGSDKDGYKRLLRITNEENTGILDKIQKKDLKVVSDTTSQELSVSNTKRASFRPNNLSSSESETDPDINTSPKIRYNKTF